MSNPLLNKLSARRRASHQVRLWSVGAGVVAFSMLAGAGCGSDTAKTGAQPPPSVAAGAATGGAKVPAAPEVANGEANTGEAPSRDFESTKNHYRVSAPGTMTEGADGVATAHFGAERLVITVLSGSAAADIGAVSRSDMDKAATTQNFKLISAPSTAKLTASNAASKAVYGSTDGANPVTGKPNNVVVVKYWVPKDLSTAAVLTYSVTDNQYDPQGADDVANTFRWL